MKEASLVLVSFLFGITCGVVGSNYYMRLGSVHDTHQRTTLQRLQTFTSQPQSQQVSYRLLPHQQASARNPFSAQDILIQSQYPISIISGNCRNDETVQWRCKGTDLGDVFITDLRHVPLLSTPTANQVLVTFKEF